MLREPATFQDCERVSGVADVVLGEPLQTSGFAASRYAKQSKAKQNKATKTADEPNYELKHRQKEHRGGLSV